MSNAIAATTARPRQGAGVLQRVLDRYLLIVYTILAVIYLMLPVALIILFTLQRPGPQVQLRPGTGFTLNVLAEPARRRSGLPQARSA